MVRTTRQLKGVEVEQAKTRLLMTNNPVEIECKTKTTRVKTESPNWVVVLNNELQVKGNVFEVVK
jgi:phage gp45-like